MEHDDINNKLEKANKQVKLKEERIFAFRLVIIRDVT
jgi:hypothetical protein